MKKKSFSHQGISCLLLFFNLFFALNCIADSIVLKNGRKFSGQIKQETSSQVTIDIGGGTITLPRSKIKSLQKIDDASDTGTYRQPVNVLFELDPTAELMPLALEFKQLKSQRSFAIQAKNTSRKIKFETARLLSQFTREKKQYDVLVERVNQSNPNQNIRAYNDLVFQQNKSVNRLDRIHNHLTSNDKAVSSAKKTVSQYQSALENINTSIVLAKSKSVIPGEEKKSALFWAKLEKKMASYQSEFKNIKVPHKSINNHLFVDGLINGKQTARFMLDTGATYVTLSEDMAQRLNLDLNNAFNVPLTLADGATVNGKLLVLNTLAVGDVKADKVSVVVLPSAPGPGIDGLLGMSFLREFVVSIDSVNQTLLLKRFEP